MAEYHPELAQGQAQVQVDLAQVQVDLAQVLADLQAIEIQDQVIVTPKVEVMLHPVLQADPKMMDTEAKTMEATATLDIHSSNGAMRASHLRQLNTIQDGLLNIIIISSLDIGHKVIERAQFRNKQSGLVENPPALFLNVMLHLLITLFSQGLPKTSSVKMLGLGAGAGLLGGAASGIAGYHVLEKYQQYNLIRNGQAMNQSDQTCQGNCPAGSECVFGICDCVSG